MAKEQMNFESMMTAERERLTKEREEIFNQQQVLETRLKEINNELRAFDVFEQAKQGKFPEQQQSQSTTRKQRASTGGKRGKREDILKLVQEAGGATRGELIERLGVKGNKSGEQSLSNALSALKRDGKITQEGGKYQAAA